MRHGRVNACLPRIVSPREAFDSGTSRVSLLNAANGRPVALRAAVARRTKGQTGCDAPWERRRRTRY